MHELSVALSILNIVADEAARRGNVAVVAVHLRLGPLSGVVRRALDGAFELAREGTAFPACRLEIEEVPIRLFCPVCQEERAAESMQMLCCVECGTPSGQIVSGREIEIAALEIEEQ